MENDGVSVSAPASQAGEVLGGVGGGGRKEGGR